MKLITQPQCQVETGPKLEVKYHACDEARDDEGVKLACGCKLPIIAGAIGQEGLRMLEELKAGNTLCCVGKVNGHDVKVMRDTGSTPCVVKTSLVKPDQMAC